MLRLTKAMQVTRSNFRSSLESVYDSINGADLLAFDTELTGLLTGDQKEDFLDSVPTRYTKLLKGSDPFIITQFGLCTFTWCNSTLRYEAKPFNFFTFPSTLRGIQRDRWFVCQSTSIEFLCANNFDFNKVFREGISYLRQEEEKTFRDNLTKTKNILAVAPKIDVPEDQKEFMDGIVSRMTAFQSGDGGLMLDLPPCNGFQRKLIFQQKDAFPGLHMHSEQNEKNERFIRCVRLVGDPKTAADKLAEEKEKEAIENAVGVSLVFKAMMDSGKLIVGHNMMLDVIHSLRQFHCKLPEEFPEFQKLVVQSMPRLVDNKLLAKHDKYQTVFDKTHLGNVFTTAQSGRFRQPAIAVHKDIQQTEQAHDAAYDAYMTGFSFLRLLRGLEDGPIATGPVDLSSEHVDKLMHKVNMMQSFDVPFIDLAQENVEPKRPNIMVMTFPKEWDFKAIMSFFTSHESAVPNQLKWINDTSAYVCFNTVVNVSLVIAELSKAASAEGVEFIPVDASGHGPTIPQKRKSSTSPDAPAADLKKQRSEDLTVLEPADPV